MKKIDFSKLPCYTDIRKQETKEVDIKFDFSNAIYMRGQGIDMGALAMKIYNAQGEEEYDEKECNIILAFAKTLSPILFDSLKDLILS